MWNPIVPHAHVPLELAAPSRPRVLHERRPPAAFAQEVSSCSSSVRKNTGQTAKADTHVRTHLHPFAQQATPRRARPIGGGKSRQSSCTSGVATRAKSQKNVAADETRSAPRLIHAPRQAATPARTPPPPQHCWLRRWRSLGGLNPHPGGSKGCAAAASSPPSTQEYITRQSSSKSISLRMTGKMTGKCRTAGNFAKSFQLPASGPGIHTVPSILVGSSLVLDLVVVP
eukprot:COSAG02_NODE_8710_length_2465_cov_4.756128_2_plen_228_part_00